MAKSKCTIKIKSSVSKEGKNAWLAVWNAFEQVSDDHLRVGGTHRVFGTREEAREYIRNVKSSFFG